MAKIVMSDIATKTVKVVPKDYRVIPDILKKRGLVDEPMDLVLNRDEIFRAMNYADVFDMDGTHLDESNYFLMDEETEAPVDPEPTPVEPEPTPEEPSEDVNNAGCFVDKETATASTTE